MHIGLVFKIIVKYIAKDLAFANLEPCQSQTDIHV